MAPPDRRRIRAAATPIGVAACLAVAAASLLATPAAPTYDPQSWLIWAREIVHGELSTTTGPSWKPLPMLALVPLSVLGDAASPLWLVVTRAAALGALWLAWRVATRLGGTPVAGWFAVGAMAITPWLLRNAWLGNSESLVALLGLRAVLDHLDGRRRWAFAAGVGVALLRPESWPWLALYGGWLVLRDRRTLVPVVAAGLLVAAAWTLPELVGSGDALRALSRAQEVTTGSTGQAAHPRLAVVRVGVRETSDAALVGLALLALGWRRRREPVVRATAALAALALGWLLVVVEMTAGGFSGSDRYLIVPLVTAAVLGGVGVGWAVQAVPIPRRAVPALAAIACGVALLPLAGTQRAIWRDMAQQGRLGSELTSAVARAGGPGRLWRCGAPGTTPLLVPQVAWALGLRLEDVSPLPAPDAFLLRGRVEPGGPLEPAPSPFRAPGSRVIASSSAWELLGRCAPPRSAGA